MTAGKEKRRAGRRQLIAEILYVSGSVSLTARISDISAGGLFVDTYNPLDTGTEVSFTLNLPSDIAPEPIKGSGTVTWRQEMMGMGIRFNRIDRDGIDRILEYIEQTKE